ncbi:CNP1-like family protein [Iodobacter arcticus]|uniref:CNP1-like family protein n=1 Tax=Iodobacter arcticus TaxID=590593 RepID=A0ABW2QY34_9NEIS
MQRFLLLALLAIPLLANAAEYNTSRPAGVESDGTTISRLLKDTPPPRPEEKAFSKPDPKKLQKWQEFTANYDSRMNQFQVALDSIEVGEDGIIRYAAAVTSKGSQVKNVSFEGIDCKTKQFRSYAYLNGDQWQDLSRDWELIVKDKRNGYQAKLAKEFCWGGAPTTVEKIVDSMSSSGPLKIVR